MIFNAHKHEREVCKLWSAGQVRVNHPVSSVTDALLEPRAVFEE